MSDGEYSCRQIPGTKNLVADWLSRMLASLFGISVDEFLARGIESADISCLLSVMIRLDAEFDVPLEVLMHVDSREIPSYVEQEGMFRPVEFAPDFVDAQEYPVEPKQPASVRTTAIKPISELVEQHIPFAHTSPHLMLTIQDLESPVDLAHEESGSAQVDAAGQEAITVLPPQGRGKDPVVVRTVTWTADDMFKEVHGGRQMHWGARRTWLRLN